MNFGKLATLYAVVTQGLISLLVLTGGGFLLGKLIEKNTKNEESLLSGFFAIIGAIIGLIYFIMSVLKEKKHMDALEKARKEKESNDK